MIMICTICGAIFNIEDKHVCDPAEIPAKGFVKKPVAVVVEVKK